MSSPAVADVEVAVAVDLQALGTLTVTACCVNQAVIDSVVAKGGIEIAIKNLQVRMKFVEGERGVKPDDAVDWTGHIFSGFISQNAVKSSSNNVIEKGRAADALTRSGDGRAVRTMTLAGGGASSEFDELLAESDSGASISFKGGLSASVLVAASLQMLSILCCTPAHTATAKSFGLIRSMLAAYTEFGSSGDVYAAFAGALIRCFFVGACAMRVRVFAWRTLSPLLIRSDLIEAVVTEEEVAAAVRGVLTATAQLRDLASDDSLFSIEDKELQDLAAPVSPISKAKPKSSTAVATVSAAIKSSGAPEARATSHNVGVSLTEHLCLLETACCRCAVCSSGALSTVF